MEREQELNRLWPIGLSVTTEFHVRPPPRHYIWKEFFFLERVIFHKCTKNAWWRLSGMTDRTREQVWCYGWRFFQSHLLVWISPLIIDGLADNVMRPCLHGVQVNGVLWLWMARLLARMTRNYHAGNCKWLVSARFILFCFDWFHVNMATNKTASWLANQQL